MVTTASSSCESFSVKKSILSWDSHYKSALCKWRGDVTIGVQAGWSYTATLPLQLAFEAHIREMALEIARFTPPHQVNTWHRHDQQLETLTFILKLSILLLPRSWGKQISIPRLREAFPPVPVYQHLLRTNESPVYSFCLQQKGCSKSFNSWKHTINLFYNFYLHQHIFCTICNLGFLFR